MITTENSIWRHSWTSKRFKDWTSHLKIFQYQYCQINMQSIRKWSSTSMSMHVTHQECLRLKSWLTKTLNNPEKLIWKVPLHSVAPIDFTTY
jgi:hypothetical protein